MTTSTKKKDFKLLFVALAIACIGLIGISQVFFNGQEASYGVSREVPFGLLLMGYAFFVGISVGISNKIIINKVQNLIFQSIYFYFPKII